MRFHEEVLPAGQRRVLHRLGPIMARERFYLAGGTAVALQVGHRRSIDLDWFTERRLDDPAALLRDLGDERLPLRSVQMARGTIHGRLSGVRISCIEYRYALLQRPRRWSAYETLVASLDDLACMKLAAVAQRGLKKDFVDVYAIGLTHRPLPDLLGLYRRKYVTDDIGPIVHGLVYFDDAERERMPRMLWDLDWRTVKRTIREWVRALAG